MSRELTGRNKVTGATLEIGQRKVIDLSSTDFVWGLNSVNAWFKIVTKDDCFLNVVLLEETGGDTAAENATLYGYYPFPKGEGSNAKVIKVFKDASNTIYGVS